MTYKGLLKVESNIVTITNVDELLGTCTELFLAATRQYVVKYANRFVPHAAEDMRHRVL